MLLRCSIRPLSSHVHPVPIALAARSIAARCKLAAVASTNHYRFSAARFSSMSASMSAAANSAQPVVADAAAVAVAPAAVTAKPRRGKSAAAAADAAPLDSIAPPPLPIERRRSGRKARTIAVEDATNDAPAPAAASSAPVAVDADEMPPAGHAVALPSAAESQLEIPCDTQEVIEMDSTFMIDDGAVVQEAVKIVRKRSVRKKVTLAYDEARFHPQALVSKLRIGCHVSAAGGCHNAIENAHLIGARAFAMDTKSKRKWDSKPIDAAEAQLFRDTLKAFKMTPEQVLPHGSYLMNLGSPNPEVFRKSKLCLLDELERCKQMGVHLYNFHPGSTCGTISKEACMTSIATCLNEAHKLTVDAASPYGGVVTVLENMAGHGGVIGASFEELAFIIALVEDKKRVGVCLDTCHAFAAGIDLRTEADVKKMFADFDRIVGLQYLRGIHLNDSKGELDCRKDRHESIGQGKIGSAGFRALMNSPQLHDIPLILETPILDPKQWVPKYSNEIHALYSMEASALPDLRPRPEYNPPSADELAESARIRKERLAANRKKKAGIMDDDEAEDDEADEDDDDAKPAKPVRRQSSAKKRKEAAVSQEEEDEEQATKKPKRTASKKKAKTSKESKENEQDDVD